METTKKKTSVVASVVVTATSTIGALVVVKSKEKSEGMIPAHGIIGHSEETGDVGPNFYDNHLGRSRSCHGAGEISPKHNDNTEAELRSVIDHEPIDDNIAKTISCDGAKPLSGRITDGEVAKERSEDSTVNYDCVFHDTKTDKTEVDGTIAMTYILELRLVSTNHSGDLHGVTTDTDHGA